MNPKTDRRADQTIAKLALHARNIMHDSPVATAVAEVKTNVIPAGLAAGALVMTLDGELPVEHLSPGDRVITRDSGVAILRDVSVVENVETYEITASSIGHDRPQNAVTVAADQKILLRDWRAKAMFGTAEALVPVSRLADGEFVKSAGVAKLFVLEFDRDHILYVDGLELAA